MCSSDLFNRDDEFQSYLEHYNDEFPIEQELYERFQAVVAFIEECGFSSESRVWRKADLLTLLVELDQAFFHDKLTLQPGDVLARLEEFYAAVDASGLDGGAVVGIYYKAALQASNDRINRVRRGLIVEGLLRKLTNDDIITTLRAQSFL